MRVLHLQAQAADFCAQRASRILAAGAIPGVEIVSQSSAHGLAAAVFQAFPKLRRLAAEFDAVHVWDRQQLLVAGQAGARRIFYSPAEMPGPGELRWLPWIVRRWPVHVVCETESRCQKLIASGLPVDQCHTIAPGVVPSPRQTDTQLRAELGFADDELVVLAPGESTHAAGHRYAIWATAILQVLDKRWRVLVWGRGPEVDRLANLVANFGQSDLLCIAERKLGKRIEFEKLITAADFALLTLDERASILPAALCAASGLPIVKWPHQTLDEIIPMDIVAASVPRRRPALLAQQLLALAADRSASDSTTESARQHAQSSLSIDRFLHSYRDLYCGK